MYPPRTHSHTQCEKLIGSHWCDLSMNRKRCSKSHLFPANDRASVKHDNQSYFKAGLKKSINLQEKERKLYNFL